MIEDLLKNLKEESDLQSSAVTAPLLSPAQSGRGGSASSPSSSPLYQPNEGLYLELVAMGFQDEDVLSALQHTDDRNSALDYLYALTPPPQNSTCSQSV